MFDFLLRSSALRSLSLATAFSYPTSASITAAEDFPNFLTFLLPFIIVYHIS